MHYKTREDRLIGGTMKVLDLFSGIGGFSLGLERAGMETVAFCEVDEHCQKILEKHWPEIPIWDDVKSLNKNALNAIGIDQIDVIAGGFPCQDISVAGKGEGLKGERSGLWFEYKRIIKEVKPTYVIIENVANLRSKGLAAVLQDLGEIGYDSEWHIIPACAVGAIHRRERIWIIAYAMREGLQRLGRSEEIEKIRLEGEISPCPLRYLSREEINSHAHDIRFRSSLTPAEEKQEWWAKTAARFRNLFGKIVSIKPAICREHDGLPRSMGGNRAQQIKQFGNAVIPQIPQIIGEAILNWESRK